MTPEEFEYLKSPEARAFIEQYIESDPMRVALKLRNQTVAMQIKQLQKCRRKLPSYYAARCIISGTTFSQSSSEESAASKEFVGGALAIDLTCGLGVDSAALARSYERVIAVEIDPIKARVARYNFSLLGIDNVEVVECAAEQFTLPQADLIYIDPSREDSSGQKVYSLEDSSPNVLELLPAMRQAAQQIVIKLSPLFDVEELFRLFTPCAAEVVTLAGECKEVLVRIGFGEENTITNTIIRQGKTSRFRFARQRTAVNLTMELPDPVRYIYRPDIAFTKSRTLVDYAVGFATRAALVGGYIVSNELLDDFAGDRFEVSEQHLYQPKILAKILRKSGVTKANINARQFRFSADSIARSLKIGQGGATELFFVEHGTELLMFVCR